MGKYIVVRYAEWGFLCNRHVMHCVVLPYQWDQDPAVFEESYDGKYRQPP